MYDVERSMLDNWAAWIRRNRYQFGPRKPKCSIGETAELGVRTGPVVYNDEAIDPDEEAQVVDAFMTLTRESSYRVYAALMARHVREFVDTRGVRWTNSQLPERKMARAMYGTSEEAARKMFRRDCEEGYARLRRY